MTDLLISQASDIFRIGLLIALILTMFRTRNASGTVLPLAAGVVFVAVLIPMTQTGARPEPLWTQVATGIVVNAVYVAIGLAIATLWMRRRN